jgi:hypothetical protein
MKILFNTSNLSILLNTNWNYSYVLLDKLKILSLWCTEYRDSLNPIKDIIIQKATSSTPLLAICLGMLYTIKLTQRFIHSDCEIHMSMPQSKNDQRFFLVVDNSKVLNLDYGSAADIESLNGYKTNKIWIGKRLP